MSTKNRTPTFSPRASALAAPKKAEPTIRPRATSSDHSTGALKQKRSSTDAQTTTRSAARRMAAIASLRRSSSVMLPWRPPERGTAAVNAISDLVISSLRRADDVDDRLGLRPRLDEVLVLRRDALLEGFAVAFGHRHALLGQSRQRLLLDR